MFTAGYGLAAAYVEDHLRAWGVKPAGDHGSYLQTVRVLGVKTTSHSTVSVTVNGETRTFNDGEGITFPKNMGGKRRFTVERVEFAGYGLDAPGAGRMDFRGKDVKDAAVIWLGANGPKNLDQSVYRRVLTGRNRYATEQLGAAASIGPASETGGQAGQVERLGRWAGGAGRRRGGPLPAADFTTVQRLDTPLPPERQRQRRVLHLSLQPGADEVRRAETSRVGAGGSAVLPRARPRSRSTSTRSIKSSARS